MWMVTYCVCVEKNTLLKLVFMRGARKTDCSLGHQHAQIKQLNIQINLISQNRYYKHLQNHALSKLSKKKLQMSQK